MKEQGFGKTSDSVSYVYEPANLADAFRFLKGFEDERALEGITQLEGISDLNHLAALPDSLQSLTLGWAFNEPLDGLSLPQNLQSCMALQKIGPFFRYFWPYIALLTEPSQGFLGVKRFWP